MSEEQSVLVAALGRRGYKNLSKFRRARSRDVVAILLPVPHSRFEDALGLGKSIFARTATGNRFGQIPKCNNSLFGVKLNTRSVSVAHGEPRFDVSVDSAPCRAFPMGQSIDQLTPNVAVLNLETSP